MNVTELEMLAIIGPGQSKALLEMNDGSVIDLAAVNDVPLPETEPIQAAFWSINRPGEPLNPKCTRLRCRAAANIR